jgi:hypothetical protein
VGAAEELNLARAQFRVALSGDFELYTPVIELEQLASLDWLDEWQDRTREQPL